MKKITFLPPAEQEMTEVARFYESQAKGLGVEFLSEVRNAVDSLAQDSEAPSNSESPSNPETPLPPDAPPPSEAPLSLENGIQRRLIRRFPCGILYIVEPDQIVIVAIMHLRRNPWAH